MADIVYCILPHKEPERVIRLINRLQTPSDHIYVHLGTDIGKEKIADWTRLITRNCKNKNVKIVSEFFCSWGSFGIVDAMLSAMRYYENANYDYFINLSGECYPLKPSEIIKKELHLQTSAFIEVFRMPFCGWLPFGGMERIQNRWYFTQRVRYPNVSLFSIPRLRKKLPNDLEPFGGSAWFCLPKQIVNYVTAYIKQNPDVRRFFSHVLIPDEIFFQTILMNSPFRTRIENDNKRYIDWTAADPRHPKILKTEDFEKLKNSGKLFARKFDHKVDKEILDRIDKEIEELRSQKA